jgi:hypothetical protein
MEVGERMKVIEEVGYLNWRVMKNLLISFPLIVGVDTGLLCVLKT